MYKLLKVCSANQFFSRTHNNIGFSSFLMYFFFIIIIITFLDGNRIVEL